MGSIARGSEVGSAGGCVFFYLINRDRHTHQPLLFPINPDIWSKVGEYSTFAKQECSSGLHIWSLYALQYSDLHSWGLLMLFFIKKILGSSNVVFYKNFHLL